MKNDKQQKHHTGFAQATLFEHGWQPWLYWVTFLIDPFQRRDRVIDWKVCLSVCLSVPHHFSLSEYWIIWWFTPCKPYIFWKHITLATSTALFRPSITKYQLVPQYNDPVPSSNNQYRPLLTSISTGRSLAINLTSYECTSAVEYDQGYLSFLFCKLSFWMIVINKTRKKKLCQTWDKYMQEFMLWRENVRGRM